MTEVSENSLEIVQIDGLVVIKIMKHCTESLPELVHGQLLGLDVDRRLEVTNCFPFPQEEEEEEGAQFQLDMMSRLKEINIDNNAIGWYQSTYLGFLNGMMINAQYNYQSSISQSVMLVYDPYRSQQGIISLRAFRLSKKFMDSFKANNSELIMITPAIIKNHGLTHEDIFQELPIEITNSPLARSLLAELETPRHKPDIFNKLNLAFHTFTEKNLELLIDGTEILTQDQNKYQYYLRHVARQQQAQEDLSRLREENERRTAEGLPPLNLSESLVNATRPVIAPNRLDALLTYNQISNFCLQVDNFAANTFTKLYLLQSLQKSSTIIFNE